MKKVYLFFAVLNMIGLTQIAQNFHWGKAEGKWAYDYGYGIVNDNNGNVYVAGKYEENNADFSGVQVPCAGNHDAFIVKYLPNGTVDWIRTAGGVLGDYAESMSTNGTHLFVSGEIEGFQQVVNFSTSSQTLLTQGDNDAFIAKYDLSGNLIWAKSEGWLYSEKALAISNDNSGNVYIAGYFTDTTKFNGTMYSAVGYRDAYIAKYDPNGNFLWFKSMGSVGRDEVKSIKCDAAGNAYICGMYSNNCNFGAQTLTCTAGYFDVFVAKYDPNGNLVWVQKGGSDYDDVAWGLTMDNAGKLYVTGEFNAYATFGTVSFATTGNSNVFIASYDPTSGSVLWAKGAGGTLIDRARGIGSNGTNMYITGQFGATANFDGHQVTAADSSDIFIAAFDNAGTFNWAVSVGGVADAPEGLGYESGNAVCAEANGNVFATGGLLDGGVFGPFSTNGYDRTDAFVTKLSSMPAAIKENANNNLYDVYPNPSSGVFQIKGLKGKADLKVYNSIGGICVIKNNIDSKDLNIDLSSFTQGVYFAEIKGEDGIAVRKKLIVKN